MNDYMADSRRALLELTEVEDTRDLPVTDVVFVTPDYTANGEYSVIDTQTFLYNRDHLRLIQRAGPALEQLMDAMHCFMQGLTLRVYDDGTVVYGDIDKWDDCPTTTSWSIKRFFDDEPVNALATTLGDVRILVPENHHRDGLQTLLTEAADQLFDGDTYAAVVLYIAEEEWFMDWLHARVTSVETDYMTTWGETIDIEHGLNRIHERDKYIIEAAEAEVKAHPEWKLMALAKGGKV